MTYVYFVFICISTKQMPFAVFFTDLSPVTRVFPSLSEAIVSRSAAHSSLHPENPVG